MNLDMTNKKKSETIGERVIRLNKESYKLGILFWEEMVKWDHTGTAGSDQYYDMDVLDMLEEQARKRY